MDTRKLIDGPQKLVTPPQGVVPPQSTATAPCGFLQPQQIFSIMADSNPPVNGETEQHAIILSLEDKH
jgi:hypothetical protein